MSWSISILTLVGMVTSAHALPEDAKSLSLRKTLKTQMEQPQDGWYSDFEKAHAVAAASKLPLVVHFQSPWCQPCKKMEREVFPRAELGQLIGKQLIAVKVNGPDDPELLAKFNILAYPTDLLIGHDGSVLARRQGFQSADSYVALLQRLASSRKLQPDFSVKAGPSNKLLPLSSQDCLDQSRALVQTPEAVLGLNGYSPVTVRQKRVWVKGSEEFKVVFEKVTYLLANAEEVAMFEEDPSKFVPGASGCDPIMLANEGRGIPGRLQIGSVYRGKMYLFHSEASRDLFKINPERYAIVPRIDTADVEFEACSLTQSVRAVSTDI